MEIYKYTCVVEKKQEKKENVWTKEKKRIRIRNHNLEILSQYFHNIF